MKVWKIKQYLPALLLYVQRRVSGERGSLVAVRIRDVCGIDRRCCTVVQRVLKRLEERPREAAQTRRIPNREERRGGGAGGS